MSDPHSDDHADESSSNDNDAPYDEPGHADRDPPGVMSYNLLRSRPARDWFAEAPHRKKPRRLIGDLWSEGEICLLFGGTASFKSVFAVQAAESIASGRAMLPFAPETPRQKVLYFDLESTAAQFALRYSATDTRGRRPRREHYAFSTKLVRVEMMSECPDPEAYGFRDYYEYLVSSMIEQIEHYRARVVIIDSIAMMARGANGRARVARAVKELRRILAEYRLSILLIGHRWSHKTPSSLSLADIAAAPAVADLCDSVVGISRSTLSPELCYIRQLKSRGRPLVYDENNVAVFQIGRRPPFDLSMSGSEPAGSPGSTSHRSPSAAAARSDQNDDRVNQSDQTLYLPPAAGPNAPSFASFDELVRHHRRTISRSMPAAIPNSRSVVSDTSPDLSEPSSDLADPPSVLAEPPLNFSDPSPGFPDSSFDIHHSSSDNVPSPFLSLHYLGHSAESVHVTDPAKQARLADELERRRRRRSKSVVNMLMSRENKRYIEG